MIERTKPYRCCICGTTSEPSLALLQDAKGKIKELDEFGNEIERVLPSFKYLNVGEQACFECYIERCVEYALRNLGYERKES